MSCASVGPTQTAVKATLFDNAFSDDLALWQIEAEAGAKVTAKNKRLHILATGGATIWFKPELKAPVEISYTVTAVDNGGPHDRVSDLNQFWMARDPDSNDLFGSKPGRTGIFGQYDRLELYYVGVGGHNNTKTRFRRYIGEQGRRPLLPEHDLSDSRFMIQGRKAHKVRIVSEGSRQRFYRDDQLVFDVTDEDPYIYGHFGFRTVRNHMIVEDFVVRSLAQPPNMTSTTGSSGM